MNAAHSCVPLLIALSFFVAHFADLLAVPKQSNKGCRLLVIEPLHRAAAFCEYLFLGHLVGFSTRLFIKDNKMSCKEFMKARILLVAVPSTGHE